MALTERDLKNRRKTTRQVFRVGSMDFNNQKEISRYYKINYNSINRYVKMGAMNDGTIIKKILIVND